MVALPILSSLTVVPGQRVLVRGSLDVPLTPQDEPRNTLRLRRILPTLRWLRERGACVALCGHIGSDGAQSTRPLARWFASALGENVEFAADFAQAHQAFAGGSPFVLLENLRRWEGEKANDPIFARSLAALADVYVNEAFAASHRRHASIVGVPRLRSAYAGFAFAEEVEALSRTLAPPTASLMILGGAKITTKLPLLLRALERYQFVVIGGVLANDVWHAQGWETGRSMLSEVAREDLALLVHHPKVVLPVDVVACHPVRGARVCPPSEVQKDEEIVDAGPQTIAGIAERAGQMDLVVWNGPLGNYERGFAAQTEALARALARVNATTIVGGGDTVASIDRLGLLERYSFVSTGGGAMLQFLTDGTLPGIAALEASLEKHGT
ncbi:phosphoglycerate kinase [Candidatus Parcubacteria bacterium]|nr:MAG: phosphoglycerate kinase [Candidatus Parcubacteria bacterium]